MAQYLSSNVQMFPSAYRTADVKSKFTSEFNFTNILRSITDIDSFVIDYSDTEHVLEAVIHGYYFKVKLDSKPENLWLAIKVATTGEFLVNYNATASADYTVLDSNSLFNGLFSSVDAITPSKQDGYTIYTLQVFDNGNLVNKAKFNLESIDGLINQLASKQDNLVVDTNILKLEDSNLGFIEELTSVLKSLKTAKGSNVKHVYVSGNEVKESNANVGSFNTAASYQSMYLNGGTMTAGQTIYWSTNDPTGGNVGDIWLKYSNN